MAGRGRLERELGRYQSTEPTYPDLGATRAELPAGYRHLRWAAPLGHGRAVFEAAAAAVLEWRMHRDAGLEVAATSTRAEVGGTVVLWLGRGPLGLLAACRVVWVLDETDRSGFAYGTLPGHPERGEEAFVVERAADDAVRFTVTAFSRPGGLWPTLAGSLIWRVQHLITTRYLRAVQMAAVSTPRR
ncbi:DUF1990 domain-containing protein [Frankia sp. CNm7]|uniref:DUF1990 domain-containing protein n=1 Tax=Frankia nepalensis TaxID=1836974 RepID=A0A937RMR9_9ACTN|nr:DUF1990 domain-containing protein [Frankia nepalensis]MBL7515483.1 DUF1990 domain-containing protein [Frankia nepalensis]MBL7517664.1 DUF1990 domain-containing protein [Frankia nepalensis]MBL7631750.1 DUF1990 domain-containing protein [Frankia nepalensis]